MRVLILVGVCLSLSGCNSTYSPGSRAYVISHSELEGERDEPSIAQELDLQ